MNNQVVTNISKNNYVIPALSVQTINFGGAKPNYYRITNGGTSNLYLGVSMTPTKKFFDLLIPSGATKVFVDAYGHDNIYLYNPATEDTNIILTSFEYEFSPIVLAMTDFGLDLSSIEINANNVITGFETPLPTGTNHLGSVNVNNIDISGLVELITSNKEFLSTIATNTNNNSNLSSISTSLTNIKNKIDSIFTEVGNIAPEINANIDITNSILRAINSALSGESATTYNTIKYESFDGPGEYTAPNGYYIYGLINYIEADTRVSAQIYIDDVITDYVYTYEDFNKDAPNLYLTKINLSNDNYVLTGGQIKLMKL